MTMPADQAAKVLRQYQMWRTGDEKTRHIPDVRVNEAIDAAVAALEVAASAEPVGFVSLAHNGHLQGSFHAEVRLGQALYAAPQPAYCCAKCGLAEMKKE